MAIAAPSEAEEREKLQFNSHTFCTHMTDSVVNWDERKGRNGGYIDNTVCTLYMDMEATPGKHIMLKGGQRLRMKQKGVLMT